MRIFLALLFSLGTFAHADTLNFAVIGDAGSWNENTRKVRDSIYKSGVRDLVLPGDNVYSFWNHFGWGSYESVWSAWKPFGFRWSVVAIGNHNSGYEKETRFFGMPAEYYAKTFGQKTRFLVLNSDNKATAPEQALWLASELASAKEPCVFIVFHHPPVTLYAKHRWTDRKEFHRRIRPVLMANQDKITALLVGHDHSAHAVLLNSTRMYVSGAAHEIYPSVEVNEMQENVQVRTAWAYKGSSPHWLRLTVNESTQEAFFSFIDANTGSESFSETRSCK